MKIKIHIFHKWSKWESYSLDKARYEDGISIHAEKVRVVTVIVKRQKRFCEECGKEQDREVASII